LGKRTKGHIFLCEAFFNRMLYDQYKLKSLGPQLEVVLDRTVARQLKREATLRGFKVARFPGVKKLTPKLSDEYQDLASKIANIDGCEFRIELEVKYFRGDNANQIKDSEEGTPEHKS
jgi:hypothetical protein